MTRINTNVLSLTAQNTLAKSNDMLQNTLTRLSTGLKINSGKDDPAGMIAASALGSTINSTQQAIANSQLAGQMISTADSALGQISSLLNDVRGLVTQAANTGAMSADQIAANQLQIDSSLSAIDRISQSTTFQGKKLLDGSLDFLTGNWAGSSTTLVKNLQVNQANLSSGALSLSVNVGTAATQAELHTAIATGGTAASTGHIDFNGGGWIQLAAKANGASANGYSLAFSETAAVAQDNAVVQVSGKTITVLVNDANNTKIDDIKNALEADATVSALFNVTESNNTDVYTKVTDAAVTGATASGADTGLAADSVFELSGNKGSQVFNFKAGTTISAVQNAINLASSSTGVSASVNGSTLKLLSTDYGSDAFVNVKTVSGTQAFTESDDLTPATRVAGTDVVGTVNGTDATGVGQNLSINTATLSMSANFTNTGTWTFDIQSGGALFQLGPDIVGSQQAQIGIQSTSTGSLGGSAGKLYQLASGQSASLSADPATAAKILDQASAQINSLRGRLGAFQKSTVQTNINSLTNAVTNLTAAQSSIQDADFAAESANLTRAQILVQSGTSVLGIANKNPENVLSLLR